MMFMSLKSDLIPEFCAGDLHWKVVSVYINKMNQVCFFLLYSIIILRFYAPLVLHNQSLNYLGIN